MDLCADLRRRGEDINRSYTTSPFILSLQLWTILFQPFPCLLPDLCKILTHSQAWWLCWGLNRLLPASLPQPASYQPAWNSAQARSPHSHFDAETVVSTRYSVMKTTFTWNKGQMEKTVCSDVQCHLCVGLLNSCEQIHGLYQEFRRGGATTCPGVCGCKRPPLSRQPALQLTEPVCRLLSAPCLLKPQLHKASSLCTPCGHLKYLSLASLSLPPVGIPPTTL